MAFQPGWWQRSLVAVAVAVSVALQGPFPAVADQEPVSASLSDQILQLVNQERATDGLATLMVDPRLVTVAKQRVQFLIEHHDFSHCSGGEDGTTCPQSGVDVGWRAAQAGIDLNLAGTSLAENLALNTYQVGGAGSAAAGTVADWLNSTEHRANILDPSYSATGVAIGCCWTGALAGRNVQAGDQASIYVQVFAGGPGIILPGTVQAAAPLSNLPGVTLPPGTCRFILGFATLAATIPKQVGHCTGDEGHNAVTGDAEHDTSGGLLVWRMADNWTAFTDGVHTWVIGPQGVAERLNTQRFHWEANPAGLPEVPS